MKKRVLRALPVFVLIAALLPGCFAYAKDVPLATRTIDPVVSTDWLAANSGLKDLVIIDIRNGALYGAGHIPNAISIPFARDRSVWITQRDILDIEVPDEADLFKVIGSAGIKSDSRIVIVNDAFPTDPQTPPSYPRSYCVCNLAHYFDSIFSQSFDVLQRDLTGRIGLSLPVSVNLFT